MADKHGPIFSIRQGLRRAIVVNDWEVVKECFTTNDKVFLTRPRSLAIKIMAYDHAMLGFAPYGTYWRDMRKLVMAELLCKRRLELLKHIRDEETEVFIRELYGRCSEIGKPVVVEMMDRFGDLAMNIIGRMIAGKRYNGGDDESKRCRKALGDFARVIGFFLVSDAVPFLGWLDYLRGYIGEMETTAKEMDSIFQSWVDEHREKKRRKIDGEEQDFVDVMLAAVMDDEETCRVDADKVVKATCLSLIIGGNDTTVVTLTWALSLLLNNRDSITKVQHELDVHVGNDRKVEESDINNLVYLQAVIKETMRLYPALPISAPREAMEDCTIAGFHVEAGTRLIVNISKVQRDPRKWANPSEFIPERFLGEKVMLDVRGQDFEYIPFGSGRRMCPGVSSALQVIHITLARLLHSFEVGVVSGGQVDMSERPGMTVPKATPLEVVLRPRLPAHLYD